MPIYEYKCTECGSHFEKIQKATDDPLKTCEKCGGSLEKQWSLSGFQFKGEGWYVTDYARDKNDQKTEKPEKETDSKSTKEAETASKPTTDTKKETVSKKD
jgi:putative FmdB family regulatory protein